MPGIGVGRIIPGGQPASGEMPRQFLARNAKQWPEPRSSPRRHPSQTSRPASPQQPQENRLGLIVRVVAKHDHAGAGLERERTQRGPPRDAGPCFRAAGAELKPGDETGKPTRLGMRDHLRSDQGTSLGNAVVDVPDHQFASVRRRAFLQQMEHGQRVGTTGHRQKAARPRGREGVEDTRDACRQGVG